MIDHVSVAVRDLAAGVAFYERVLAPLGYTRLVERPATVGFGKKYPEFWLNVRAGIGPAPAGRVGDWRAGVGRSLCSLLSRSFVCECHTISTMPRFQSPPRRTQRADFPHYAHLFASRQGLWDLSCWGDFRLRPLNLVAVEQLQGCVQPWPTPPRPAEAIAFPGSQHVAPNLLFHPVFDEAEACAGMADRKVIHPTAQHRIDQLHDPIHWLRLVAAEHVLELP